MDKLSALQALLDEVERKIPLAATAEADEHDDLELERIDLLREIATLSGSSSVKS